MVLILLTAIYGVVMTAKTRTAKPDRPHVLLFVGLPGGGKSTYANKMRQRGYTVISVDDIRKELTGDAGSQRCNPWPLAFERLEAAIREKKNVVFDATNCISSSRSEFVRKCWEYGCNDVRAVYFATPLRICLERNAARDRVVPKSVIRRMSGHLHKVPLTVAQFKGEGFSKFIIVTPSVGS